MFRNKKQMTIGIIVGSLVIITIIGLVYAAFTQQLNINGSGNARNSTWHVYFSDLSNANLVGTATEQTHPTIQDNATSIKTYAVSVSTPGDSITYTFKVNNDGDYDAKLTGLTLNTPSCTGTDSTSNTNVCSKLRYTLKYENGTSVAENDMLASKETKTMVLKLEYQEFDDASLLPTANVTIGNLGIDLEYTQEGKAKTNSDGTTPYVAPQPVYSIGDYINYNGLNYYVIENSGSDKNYVKLLRENSITYSEVSSSIDPGSFSDGLKANYGETNDYDTSNVKSIVDAWAAENVIEQDVKEVRLITYDEIINNFVIDEYQDMGCGGPCSGVFIKKISSNTSWMYGFDYWTMTPLENNSSWLKVIDSDGTLKSQTSTVPKYVRPVIILYKSANIIKI